jgi:hypothetical protein
VYNYWFFSMFLITLYLNCSLTIVCYISWVAQNLWWIDWHLQTLIQILCFENKIFLTMPYTILDPFLIQKEKLELSLIIVLKNLNFIFKSFYWWGSFVLIFINLKSIRSPRFEFVAWYNLLNHFSNTWISWFVYFDSIQFSNSWIYVLIFDHLEWFSSCAFEPVSLSDYNSYHFQNLYLLHVDFNSNLS